MRRGTNLTTAIVNACCGFARAKEWERSNNEKPQVLCKSVFVVRIVIVSMLFQDKDLG